MVTDSTSSMALDNGFIKLFKTFLDFFIVINFFTTELAKKLISITVKEFYIIMLLRKHLEYTIVYIVSIHCMLW